MPKGYWIARVTVTEPDGYKLYAAAAGEAFAKYGARILARGGRYEAVEGEARPRNVVIEFPSLESALACWNSPEYQRAKSLREGKGVAEVVLLEGYDPEA